MNGIIEPMAHPLSTTMASGVGIYMAKPIGITVLRMIQDGGLFVETSYHEYSYKFD
jgi:uncharacterized membrane protein